MQAGKGIFILFLRPFILTWLTFLKTCRHGISSSLVNRLREVLPHGGGLSSLIPERRSLELLSQSCTGIAVGWKALLKELVICWVTESVKRW